MEQSGSSEGQSITPATETILPPEEKYKGVRGWLLFFCITLTILTPIGTLFVIEQTSDSLQPYFKYYPHLENFSHALALLNYAMAIYAIVIGIKLWRVRPGAVHAAKVFLWFVLAFSVGVIFLPFLFGLPFGTVFVKPGGIGYFLVWFFYLKKSKRVKATYGDSAAA